MAIPPIGAHLSTAGGIAKAVGRAVDINADALQLFVSSPRTWAAAELEEEAVVAFNQAKEEAGLKAVLVHGLYLCNFASDKDDLLEKSIAALSAQLRGSVRIGADFCFHVGSHQGRGFEKSLERIIPSLKECLSHCQEDTHLLLENSAGAGGTVGRSIEELAVIIKELGSPPRVGICLETCHLYVSGYDLTDKSVVAEMLAEIKETIGLERLRAIHANDSKTPLGSNRDRHENILEGEMKAGLSTFLTNPALADIPVFLETPGVDKKGPNSSEVAKLRAFYS